MRKDYTLTQEAVILAKIFCMPRVFIVMSVYTQLNLEQVHTFAMQFGLEIIEIEPIQGGIENTNYFITEKNGQEFVLTVFEELDLNAASELFPVLQHLEQHGIAVAVPLTFNDQPIHSIVGKPAQIAPRIAGKHPIPSTIAQVAAMGDALAKMHLALQDYPLQRKNNHDHAWWSSTAHALYPKMNEADQALLTQVFAQYEQMFDAYPNRPYGLIHADLFRDNSLYVGDSLSGILDFSELSYDQLLLDISITMNDFCSDYPNVSLDVEKVQAFLNAYQTVRALTDDEKSCLQTYLAMAACRFWISRLQVAERNRNEGRTGTEILQKDPQEMRNMTHDRLNTEYAL